MLFNQVRLQAEAELPARQSPHTFFSGLAATAAGTSHPGLRANCRTIHPQSAGSLPESGDVQPRSTPSLAANPTPSFNPASRPQGSGMAGRGCLPAGAVGPERRPGCAMGAMRRRGVSPLEAARVRAGSRSRLSCCWLSGGGFVSFTWQPGVRRLAHHWRDTRPWAGGRGHPLNLATDAVLLHVWETTVSRPRWA